MNLSLSKCGSGYCTCGSVIDCQIRSTLVINSNELLNNAGPLNAHRDSDIVVDFALNLKFKPPKAFKCGLNVVLNIANPNVMIPKYNCFDYFCTTYTYVSVSCTVTKEVLSE